MPTFFQVFGRNRALVVLIAAVSFFIIVFATISYFYFSRPSSENVSIATPQDKTVSPDVLEQTSPEVLEGDFIFDTAHPLQNSTVTISGVSDSDLSYKIVTFNLGHSGEIEGIARRTDAAVARYTGVVASDVDEESKCLVEMVFKNPSELEYTVSGEGCSEFHGAHGMFFNDSLHKRGGKVTLPTIEKLGFTREDREALRALTLEKSSDQSLLDYVEGFIDLEQVEVKKIESGEIPGSRGYAIVAPNLYDGVSNCFPEPGGYCAFVAFLKDDMDHYWILEGTNSLQDFRYATNHESSRAALPRAFVEELRRLSVPLDAVQFVSQKK